MQPIKCLAYVLSLGAVLFMTAQAQSPNPMDPAQPRRAELQRALASFASWAKRYTTRSGAVAGRQTIEEGQALAKQRRVALLELIQSDPALALAQTIPDTLRQQLPEEIANELETPVSGIGDLLVACEMPTPGAAEPVSLRRLVRVDGQTYRTFLYGRRLNETTKFKIPLHGVAVGDVLALNEAALSELEPSEAQQTTDAIIDLTASAGAGVATGPARLARMGKTIYRFASLEHLRKSEAMLEAAESAFRAELAQPASVLLEQGPQATIDESKAAHPLQQVSPTKRVLVIRVDFSDMPGDPGWPGSSQRFTAESVQTLADTQLSPYYQASSYGKAKLGFTVSPRVYRLPQTALNYATVSLYYELYDDAVAAAQADYPMSNYDVIAVLFSWLGNLPGSRIQFGGLSAIGAGIMCINGEFDFRVMAHELGHSYGLYHANVWKAADGNPISDSGSSSEYSDVFDTMGANWGNDHRTDFNPWFKRMLNWIPDDQVQTVTTNGVYRVYRFDDAQANGTLALRVAKDSLRDYWIGCRRNFTENTSMQHGAYVTWGYNQNRQSDLLCLGATPNDPRDAALKIGTTLADPEANLSITVVAEGGVSPGEYLDVQVNLGPPPLILAQPQPQQVLEGQNAHFSIGVNAQPGLGFVWQQLPVGASNWITLSDGLDCDGTATTTLNIYSATVLMNGDSFRCLVADSAGGFNSSHPAVLAVDPLATSAPALRINMLSGQLVLSWPVSAKAYTLEMRKGLSPSDPWIAVQASPRIVGRNFVWTPEMRSPSAFFRLRQ